MEQTFLSIYQRLRTREISDMIYTFALNDYKCSRLIEKVVQTLLDRSSSFKMQEIAHIAVACDKFEVINEELLQLFKQLFMNRQEYVNVQDVGDLYMVFARHEAFDEELMDTFRKVYRMLRANIEYYNLRKFLTNAASLLNKGILPHRFFK